MTALHAVGLLLIAFAIAKLVIAGAAIRRLRAHRAGTAPDPAAGHARPWLFGAWVGWRIAAAIVAATAGVWLLAR
jgi:hypothetical protein